MLIWGGFILLIILLLALDLGVLNRKAHVISAKEAGGWTTLWVSLSLLFSIFVYFGYELHWQGLGVTLGNPMSGKEALLTYLTGYLIEQSLSVDNIFVIAMIFAYFKIPDKYQHRVLFWGILGALVFRGIMIAAGAFLINRFSWITYVFGAILLYSAYRMAKADHEGVDPDKNKMVQFFKRLFPVVPYMVKDQFFIRRLGVVAATPLFIALLVVETTDVMFAVDSIPAIFAITTDPFIVFTSNIFAILGLRSLYFLLASMLNKFQYLQYSLVVILAFVGIKMILVHLVHLPTWLSLGFILLALLAGILYSVYRSRSPEE